MKLTLYFFGKILKLITPKFHLLSVAGDDNLRANFNRGDRFISATRAIARARAYLKFVKILGSNPLLGFLTKQPNLLHPKNLATPQLNLLTG